MGGLAGVLLLVGSLAQAIPQSGQPPASAASVPASRQARNVAVITISREIDATMARSVRRRLQVAADAGADAIVFELDTPGGEVGAVLEICNLIKTSPVANTIAWINTDAYSGGALVALACREIIVAGVARMGDAAPIAIHPLQGLQNLQETERQKIMAPLLAEVVDSARRRGYDEKLVQGIVTRGVELWLIENRKTGQRLFIGREEHQMLFGEPPASEPLALVSAPGQIPAPATPTPSDGGPVEGARPLTTPPASTDFLPASPGMSDQVRKEINDSLQVSSTRPVLSESDRGQWRKIEKVSDGQGIFTFTDAQLLRYGLAVATVKNEQELQAFFGASNVRRLHESWSESLVVFLTQIPVRGLLIVVFLISLFIEMTHPGLILPGAIAAAALVMLIAPAFLNDMASWWEIAAILVGLACIALELFVIPGFGIFGVAGILLLFGGLVGTFVSNSGGLFPDTPEDRSDMLYGVTTILISFATSGVLMYFLGKHFGSLPVIGKLLLRDESGQQDAGAGLLAAMEAHPEGPIRAGAIGVALTPLRPAGRVQVGDQIIDVVSDLGFISAGASVRISSVDSFRIVVEPVVSSVQPPAPPASGSGPAEGGSTA